MAEMVSTNQFKNGMHIELEGGTWRIIEFQHVKPGKGGAFVRTKLKSTDSGSVVDKTFRAGEKFARVRAGETGSDVDAVARDLIDATEFAGTFGHGLGHGVGMDIHELPNMRADEDHVLAPGNVVSCEPGIYLPGEGGIRIEDLVVVREGEPVVLTSFTKELVTVG